MRTTHILTIVLLGVGVASGVLIATYVVGGVRNRERAIADASQQLGNRADALVDAVFWLVDADPSNLATIRAGRVPSFAEGARGLATAIHSAGYFLTAAHAVQGNVHVFGRFVENLEARRAHVIFRGEGRNPADDFCILRVDGPVRVTLPFADHELRNETLFSILRDGDSRVVAAGRVTKILEAAPTARARCIRTNFQLTGGDSGGPVLNTQLEIVGVTSASLRNKFLRIQAAGLACCPSRATIDAIIAHDLSARRDAAATAPGFHP